MKTQNLLKPKSMIRGALIGFVFTLTFHMANAQIEVVTGGNVGVGIVNPTEKLEVDGNIKLKDGSKWIGLSDTQGFYFSDAGNVGLGTVTPTEKFEVNGNIKLTGSNQWIGLSDTQGFYFSNTGNIGLGTVTPTEKFEINGNIKLTGGNQWVGLSDTQGLYVSDSGNIGIGTATPMEKLEVDGNIKFTGGDQWIGLSDTQGLYVSDSGNIGMGTSDPSSKLHIKGGHVYVDNGYVGIGTDDPKAPLHVQDSVFYDLDVDYGYLNRGGVTGIGPDDNVEKEVSIYTSGIIKAFEFRASAETLSSDRRIKEVKGISNSSDDLQTLLNIQVTDYGYIDKLNHGNTIKKGVIAQEVEAIFPQAIRKSEDFIPNVYELTSNIGHNSDKLTITLEKAHTFQKGDLIKLITNSGEIRKEVTRIINDHTFVLNNWSGAVPEKVLVYGKQVDDFRSVDYDQLFTLGISAIQALHQELEQVKSENRQLKALMSDFKAQNTGIKSLKAELKALKALLQTQPTSSNTSSSTSRSK